MKNKYRFLSLVLLGYSMINVSCDNHEEEDFSHSKNPHYEVTVSSMTVNEGEAVTVTLTPDFVPNEDVSFRLSIKEGSALDMEDFEVVGPGHSDIEWGDPDGLTYEIQIPKLTSSYSFDISTIVDLPLDENESVTFELSRAGYRNGTVDMSEFTININNTKSDIVYFYGGWNESFDFGGTTYSLCDIGFDMDFLYADAMGNIVDYFGSYDQCPEVAEVSMSEWGDGTWHVFNTVYDNAGLAGAVSPAFSIPVTLDYSRPGSALNGTYIQDAANAYDSDVPSDPTTADVRYAYSFTIDNTNNLVTVFDMSTGVEIGTGRVVASPGKVPALKGMNNFQRR